MGNVKDNYEIMFNISRCSKYFSIKRNAWNWH